MPFHLPSSNPQSGRLTILETKGSITPEEVKLSLSWEKRAGDRHSTPAAESLDECDKVAETSNHCGIGRGREMQPGVQLRRIPPALPDWQYGGL